MIRYICGLETEEEYTELS